MYIGGWTSPVDPPDGHVRNHVDSRSSITLFNLQGLTLNSTGDIAQLGERLPCTQEVTSSNLVISTSQIRRNTDAGRRLWTLKTA